MDEQNLEASLELYKSQLQQVDQALQAAGDSEDLLKLKTDLTELVQLTEGSLLSLRKSQLLQSLDDDQTGSDDAENSGSPDDSMDAEYAAFQALISAEDKTPPNHSVPSGNVSLPDSSNLLEISDIYKDIIGTKCRAPYTHEWGAMSHYNGLIVGIESQVNEQEDMPKVRVMFCTPTHNSMLPCNFYLEGRCKFKDEDCRYSHGYVVDLEDLREYEEPDYSCLSVGGKCLARYEDDLWYSATVVDLHDNHTVTVKYDSYRETATVDLEDVLPKDSEEDLSSESDEEVLNQPISDVEDDEDNEMPVFLWRPPQTTDALGQWEVHTKGIGSKLMARMGYVVGQGLGKNGEGRAIPVPIQLLPQGKSLDKIMELKQIAGNQDLFDVMKRLEKRRKQQEKKQEANIQKKKSVPNVFDFINKKLGGKKGKISELVHKHSGESHSSSHHHGRPHRQISEQDLGKKSDKHIGVQLLKTSEEIRSVERELARLQQSLSRNEARDGHMASQVRQKIQSLEQYLSKLQSSERTMEQHRKKRSDHKKLTIF